MAVIPTAGVITRQRVIVVKPGVCMCVCSTQILVTVVKIATNLVTVLETASVIGSKKFGPRQIGVVCNTDLRLSSK